MGFQVVLPAVTNSIGGNVYTIPVQFYANDLYRMKFGQNTTYSATENDSIKDCLDYAVEWLHFNPWEIARTYYTTNDYFDDLPSIVSSIYNYTHTSVNKLPGNITTYTFNDNTTAAARNDITTPVTWAKQSWDYYDGITYALTNSDKTLTLTWQIYIVPEDALKGGKIQTDQNECCQITITLILKRTTTLDPFLPYSISVVSRGAAYVYTSNFSVLPDLMNKTYEALDGDMLSADSDNPYAIDPAEPGGADGQGTFADVDGVEKIEFPDLPTLSPTNAGFITMYNPSNAQLTSLAAFLWSSAFDIDSFKKLFADPMDCIIGLGIIPVNPTLAGSKTVKFGDVDSGISMAYLSNQFVEKDMGSIEIKKYVGSFLDFPPYVKIDIYLPYIGMRELSADDVMGRTITLKYHIDCLTGGCAAMIYVSGRGVLYQFNGNCIANVPLTAINYSGAIQNAVSAAGNVITTAVGAATGAAPIAAVGVAGLASNAANAAVNSKPTIQRTGSMGGAAGLMSVQQPYVIINRPRMCVPANLNKFIGNMVNINMKLQNCVGFTMVDMIILDSIPCTDNERDELYSILKEGVIF